MPGHKTLIFGIKKEIEDFPGSKKSKNDKKPNAVLSERDLQTSLLQQMLAFTKQLGLVADWSNSILETTFTATESASFCTCTVKCPLCMTNFTLRYDRHWKTSNLCRHVRKHVQSPAVPTVNSHINNPNACSNKAVTAKIYEVEDILESNTDLPAEYLEVDVDDEMISYEEY